MYPMIPTEFIVFNPNVKHSSDKIRTPNKQRMAIDFTVTKLWKHQVQKQKVENYNNGCEIF